MYVCVNECYECARALWLWPLEIAEGNDVKFSHKILISCLYGQSCTHTHIFCHSLSLSLPACPMLWLYTALYWYTIHYYLHYHHCCRSCCFRFWNLCGWYSIACDSASNVRTNITYVWWRSAMSCSHTHIRKGSIVIPIIFPLKRRTIFVWFFERTTDLFRIWCSHDPKDYCHWYEACSFQHGDHEPPFSVPFWLHQIRARCRICTVFLLLLWLWWFTDEKKM